MPKLLIVGSIAFDNIKTPFGQANDALGGGGTYASLAASYFTKPSLVSIVGNDFKAKHKKLFTLRQVDISGVKTVAKKTFRWGGEYSFDLNNRTTLFTELNALADLNPQLNESQALSELVFLSCISPVQQTQVLKQAKNCRFVVLDTITFWIDQDKAGLKNNLKFVDCFLINDSEARQLTGEHNLVKAAKKILGIMTPATPPSPQLGHPSSGRKGKPILIIKRGEYGLLMFYEDAIFHLPGFPLEDVIDPTGAGDSFAGGFLGFLAKTGDLSFENLKRACVYGSVMASFACEKLATERLQNLSPDDINRRYSQFRELTHFEII